MRTTVAVLILAMIIGCVAPPITKLPERDTAFYIAHFSAARFRSVYAAGGIFYKDSRYDGIPFSFVYLSDGANARRRITLKDGIFNSPAADIILAGGTVRASIPFLKTNMAGPISTVAPGLGGIDIDTLVLLLDLRFIDTARKFSKAAMTVTNDAAELTLEYEAWQDIIRFSPSSMRITSLTRRSYGNDITMTLRDHRDDPSGIYPGTVIIASKSPKTEIRMHFSMFVANENVNFKESDFR